MAEDVELVSIEAPSVIGVRRTRRTKSTVTGSTVSFHRLSFFVDAPATDGRRRCDCCRTAAKQILHDVSGVFKPGVNAIMGPSGCGKTTLLDVLAGRTERKGVRGHLLVDGRDQPHNFKCMTGYVVQDDVVMGTLTVRENLMFSANLRLPEIMRDEEKRNRVDEAIEELGLAKCADTKVGTAFIRGVSGGERKRVNIGMELIISPGILFLDEPTTGLDASTANTVMSILHRLSLRGRTIIISIHQPRFAIFKLFDRLSLLAGGRTVYHGKAAEALKFFECIGYVCEQYNNPPDFFLDVINGDCTAVPQNEEAARKCELSRETDKTNSDEELATKFQQSAWAQIVAAEGNAILSRYVSGKQSGSAVAVRKGRYATTFPYQLMIVAKRAFLNLVRNPQTSILQMFVFVFMSVIMGIIFFQLDLSRNGLQSRHGLLFFIAVNTMFNNVAAIEIFIAERVIFVHESASGFYRVSTYFISKVFCDIIPMRAVPLCVYSVIIYFMAGLQVSVSKFFIFFLDLFLGTMCASAIAFLVSASVGVFAIANIIVVLILILMMMFAGLLVNVDSLGDWISWMKYLSCVRYSLNTLLINEIEDLTFTDPKTNMALNGSKYLTDQGIEHDSDWGLWPNILALGVITMVLMIFAYVQLRQMKKLK